jgi:sugar (pentulose or hexulose) kinase
VTDPLRRLWTNVHVEDGRWTLESNAGFTGRSIKWLKSFMASDEEYDALNRDAGLVTPGSNGLLTYLGAHVFDSGPPYWEHDRLGNRNVPPTITGKSGFSRGELARSIIESNCYAVRANLEQLTEVSGSKFTCLKFCGGNSMSALWVQTQADVLGVPVITPEVSEGTAVGAAALASVGSGFYKDMGQALNAMVRLMKPVSPDEERSTSYESLYRGWRAVRERLHETL